MLANRQFDPFLDLFLMRGVSEQLNIGKAKTSRGFPINRIVEYVSRSCSRGVNDPSGSVC